MNLVWICFGDGNGQKAACYEFVLSKVSFRSQTVIEPGVGIFVYYACSSVHIVTGSQDPFIHLLSRKAGKLHVTVIEA